MLQPSPYWLRVQFPKELAGVPCATPNRHPMRCLAKAKAGLLVTGDIEALQQGGNNPKWHVEFQHRLEVKPGAPTSWQNHINFNATSLRMQNLAISWCIKITQTYCLFVDSGISNNPRFHTLSPLNGSPGQGLQRPAATSKVEIQRCDFGGITEGTCEGGERKPARVFSVKPARKMTSNIDYPIISHLSNMPTFFWAKTRQIRGADTPRARNVPGKEAGQRQTKWHTVWCAISICHTWPRR